MTMRTMRYASLCCFVSVMAGMAVLSATTPAQAQEDPKAVARAKLVEGSDLLKRGEYREALVRFQEAYALVPSPKILYNFGLAYIGLSRNADAIDAFEKFLAEALDAAPELRANAERHRTTLAQQTGSLIVETDVKDAEISVDGRARGTTPAPGPIRLDPGPHQLVVEKAGLPPYTRRMTIEAGQKIIVEARLTKEAAPAPLPVITVVQAPQPVRVPEKSTPSHTLKWKLGLGLGVVAVAALGFGVVERLGANSKFNDFNNHPDTGQGPGQCDTDPRVPRNGGADCTSLLDAGNSAASKATVGLIIGGVLAAGSVALLAVSWNDRVEESPRTAARPSATTMALRCNPSLLTPGLSCLLRF
jgi:hypothetical protein